MNTKVKFSILAIVILIAISAYLILQERIEPIELIKPPPAILKIDGKEQISGIGSYCWMESWNGVSWNGVCADYVGIPTVSEPLPAKSPVTAHLSLPVKEPPQELQLKIVQVTYKDALETGAGDLRFWNSSEGKYFVLPLESEQDVNLSLEPGLYVAEVLPRWKDKGSASYGFLVEVQANGKPEVLKISPVTDYNPLEGFFGKSEGMFTVLKGSIPEVKESLKDIVIKKVAQQSTFSVDDELNFVVFRGVFGSGGYRIDIDRVEKQGNIFTVYATYIDPGEGILVSDAITQPVAIIPIGRLAAGDYEARLKVTKMRADADGTKIIRKVVETEKELSVFNFKVKTPEEAIYYTETGGFNKTV